MTDKPDKTPDPLGVLTEEERLDVDELPYYGRAIILALKEENERITSAFKSLNDTLGLERQRERYRAEELAANKAALAIPCAHPAEFVGYWEDGTRHCWECEWYIQWDAAALAEKERDTAIRERDAANEAGKRLTAEFNELKAELDKFKAEHETLLVVALSEEKKKRWATERLSSEIVTDRGQTPDEIAKLRTDLDAAIRERNWLQGETGLLNGIARGDRSSMEYKEGIARKLKHPLNADTAKVLLRIQGHIEERDEARRRARFASGLLAGYGSYENDAAVAAQDQCEGRRGRMFDIEALRSLALAATPGPWRAIKNDDWFVAFTEDEHAPDDRADSTLLDEHNAAYIAAADPTTILALCARVKAAEAKVTPEQEAWANAIEHNRRLTRELQAANDKLTDANNKLEACYSAARGEQGVIIEGVGELVSGAWLQAANEENARLREALLRNRKERDTAIQLAEQAETESAASHYALTRLTSPQSFNPTLERARTAVGAREARIVESEAEVARLREKSPTAGFPHLGEICCACGEDSPRQECAASKRKCGHHCNCSWIHDQCCWCGASFGDEVLRSPTKLALAESEQQKEK